jgi:hypothetical protein
MELEQWKTIPKYNDYEVSNLGRVRSKERKILVKLKNSEYLKTVRERLLKPVNGQGNYLYVNLYPNPKCIKIQYLVLWAFVGERPKGRVVRHLNGDPKDNSLSNLAYGTQSENRLDAEKHDKHRIKKAIKEAVRNASGTLQEISDRFKISKTYVRMLRASCKRI